MILIHLGFPQNFISWIMACITTPTFSVLINGSASQFFHSERGLRQGFPLSPLLFLIFMDALSRLIDSAKRNGDYNGLRITDECSLTHLLFVDDVMIFLDGSIRDSQAFSNIINLFSSATGMLVCLQTTPSHLSSYPEPPSMNLSLLNNAFHTPSIHSIMA